MGKHKRILSSLSLVFGILALLAAAAVADGVKTTHPQLDEQEMLIACSECHKEATPDVYKQWYDSVHGIAMVKCYQCHGTFETFRVTPTTDDCAACHANMLEKCPKDKPCWECHVPHTFKAN